MANHPHNGGRDSGLPDDQRTSWRPQDQSQSRHRDDDERYGHGYRDDRRMDRDPRRWEGSRGSELGSYDDRDRDPSWRGTEHYGQGQSGYSAGRHGDDRAQRGQSRNAMIPAYGHEDRPHDLGVDDRFTGRGRSGYWMDRGPDERMGYHSYPASQASQATPPLGAGYGGSRQQALQDDRSGHTHRGTGPHRGKGPASYQRSDERIREGVCESLADDDHIDATHIEVVVKSGDVTLTGTVDDRRAKRDAEDCAYSVPGVRDVQNQLRVRDDDRAGKGNAFQTSSVGSNETEAPSQERKHRA